MKTAEVTTNGLMQSISLPQEYQVDGNQVLVKRVGRALLLIPKDVDPWQMFTQSLLEFTDDFMEERLQPMRQERSVDIE
jgi:antitoxin VapB